MSYNGITLAKTLFSRVEVVKSGELLWEVRRPKRLIFSLTHTVIVNSSNTLLSFEFEHITKTPKLDLKTFHII